MIALLCADACHRSPDGAARSTAVVDVERSSRVATANVAAGMASGIDLRHLNGRSLEVAALRPASRGREPRGG
jgi:hypothetical protein